MLKESRQCWCGNTFTAAAAVGVQPAAHPPCRAFCCECGKGGCDQEVDGGEKGMVARPDLAVLCVLAFFMCRGVEEAVEERRECPAIVLMFPFHFAKTVSRCGSRGGGGGRGLGGW